jgi:hypothetical protein
MPFYREKLGDFDTFDRHCIGSQLKFSWLPRRCYQTGRSLWLKRAYKRSALWTGPGTPVWEYRWYHKHEYLKLKIKGEV